MSDPDDPLLSLSWVVEGGNPELFTAEVEGNRLKVLPEAGARGTATIILLLYDPWGLVDNYDIEVTVEMERDEEGTSDWSLLWIILIIILVVVGIGYWLMRPKEPKGPQDTLKVDPNLKAADEGSEGEWPFED